MSDIPGKRLLLLGEFGAFGRHLAVRLARLPGVTLTLAGPSSRSAEAFARDQALAYQALNPDDDRALERLLAGVFAVVNTWRPLMGGDYPLATLCAERGVHYADVADEREEVTGIERFARQAERSGARLVSGAGASPMLSAALVDLARRDFDRLSEIHVFLVPGRDDGRELATARLILSRLHDPIRFKERGRWQETRRWHRPRVLRFPLPIGRRRGYLSDLPELDLFPKRYEVGTVTARTGLRSIWYNLGIRLMSLSARWRDTRHPPAWLTALLRLSPRLPGGRGRPGAALRVELRGQCGGEECVHALTVVVSAAPGLALTSAPLTALVRQWVERGPGNAGAGSGEGLVGWDDIRLELQREGTDVRLLRAWEKV